jgi:coenzyme F420 hydrogenase subunit beta
MKKTFFDLIQEVQKPGLCHRCGGCVSFCSAINYGALELGEDGRPRYKEPEKCIECGICYAICPVTHELEQESRELVGWTLPMGRVFETTIARAADPAVRSEATDGGVVTALLLRLFDEGRIDGAIVSHQFAPFQRQPWLATSRKEILEAAGSHYDESPSMDMLGAHYSTFAPSIRALGPVARRGLRRVAMVGTPCQIRTMRKMEALGIVPSDVILYKLGLFCTKNFIFDEAERARLEELGGFAWSDIAKINVKEALRIHLQDGAVKRIPFDQLDFMSRPACRYCGDYSAEFADVSFGGLGAEKGWTTVITRTPVGRAIFADARGSVLEDYKYSKDSKLVSQAHEKVRQASERKRAAAHANRKELEKKTVTVGA